MPGGISERRVLRRIAVLRSLSSNELTDIQHRMIRRSYTPGEVIWRAHTPIEFTGYIQNGEVNLEYRLDNVLVRTIKLCAGDLLPSRNLKGRSQHMTVIARAITDVDLSFLPDAQTVRKQVVQDNRSRLAGEGSGITRWNHILPVLLLSLIIGLAWTDLTRIVSGLIYLASSHGEYAAPQDSRAMSLLKVAEQVDQQAAFVYNAEGYRWFQQENLPGAEAAFREALIRDKTNVPALNNLAITSFAKGDLLQATSYLRWATEQDPDNAILHYNLGILLMQLNDPGDAIQEFRIASFIDPGAAAPLLLQAYLYNQIGNYASAEQCARDAIHLNPSLTSARLTLGIILYNQGRANDALASIAETLAVDPENRVASFYQALILGHLGQTDVALTILQKLLATSRDGEEAARILVEIDALYRFQSESKVTGQ